MDDKLEKWHLIKNDLRKSAKEIYFHEREVWWCSVGENIGFEENGKGEEFTRPIVILKRLSLDTCLIIPLTTSSKRKNILSVGVLDGEDEESFAMAEQVRLVDAKRLGLKIGSIDKEKFDKLVDFTKKIIFNSV